MNNKVKIANEQEVKIVEVKEVKEVKGEKKEEKKDEVKGENKITSIVKKTLNKVKTKLENKKIHNGFYYTTIDNIHNYYHKGCWLWIVKFPKNAKKQEIKTENGIIWKTDKIILKEKYYLYDPTTIAEFKLPYDHRVIDQLSKLNDLKTLRKWYTSKMTKKFSSIAIDEASSLGHVNVLNWWLTKNTKLLKYSTNAVDGASANGHVEILNIWFNNSNLKVKNIFILNEKNLEFKYTAQAIGFASMNGHVNVLNWWLNKGENSNIRSILQIEYNKNAIDWASMNGHVNVLEWWKNSGLELKYSENAIDRASENHQLDVLKWWEQSELDLKYTEYGSKMAKTKEIKEWWDCSV